MERDALQRVALTVPGLRVAVVLNERGVATQGVGDGDAAVAAQRVDRALRALDRVGRSLRLGRLTSFGAAGRGASVFVEASQPRAVVALFGGEVRDVEGTASTIGELVGAAAR